MQYLYSIIQYLENVSSCVRCLGRENSHENNNFSAASIWFRFDISFDVRYSNDYQLTIKRKCKHEANIWYMYESSKK